MNNTEWNWDEIGEAAMRRRISRQVRAEKEIHADIGKLNLAARQLWKGIRAAVMEEGVPDDMADEVTLATIQFMGKVRGENE